MPVCIKQFVYKEAVVRATGPESPTVSNGEDGHICPPTPSLQKSLRHEIFIDKNFYCVDSEEVYNVHAYSHFNISS